LSDWRLIDSGPGEGAWNLALDDAIFRSVRERRSPPTLRLYAWAAPTLSLGYGQDRDDDVDLAACAARGIPVIRRATGGRAVLHDREITYSVAVPAGAEPFGAGLDAAYSAVAAGLLAGLQQLGLEASLAPRERGGAPPGRRAGCFASVARHEIVACGRKLVGSAQRRSGGAFLQQGSILLEGHGDRLDQLLRPRADAAGQGAMAGLAELLRPCPGHAETVAAIAEGCAASWGVRLLPGEPTAAEAAGARELERSRYRSEGWNGAVRGRGARIGRGRICDGVR